MAGTALDLIGKGIMPFMGGLRKFMPWLYSVAKKHDLVQPHVRFNDMTCGSASGAALFRFHGMNVHANDLSLRSFLSATAVFGSHKGDIPTLRRLVKSADRSGTLHPEGKVAGADLGNIAEFLHPIAIRVFEALYWAEERGELTDPAAAAFYRYMALRWVTLNKPYMYFLKLPTSDLDQLAIQGPQWEKVVAGILDPVKAIGQPMKDVNHLISAFPRGATATVSRGDCREVINDMAFGDMSITNLNPPTAGNSVFMQSNRVLDTLLFNEPQNLKDDAMPADLWRSIILDTGFKVPVGHYIYSFSGDGALTWDEGMEVWRELGDIIEQWSFEDHGEPQRIAGLTMIKRR